MNFPNRPSLVGHLIGRTLFASYLLAAAGCASSEAPLTGFLVSGVATLPQFEGADSSMVVPFVVSRLTLDDRELDVEGLQARVDLVRDSTWRAGPALSVTLPRGENADSDAIALLEERSVAVEAGGFVGFRTAVDGVREGTLTGTLSVRQDVTGVHDGTLATAELEGFFAANYMLRFGAGLSVTAASAEYMDSYYTTKPGNAAGLRPFDAGAGVKDATLEVFSILSFSEARGVFVRGAYTRLLGDARDSSIVTREGDDEQLFFGAGYFWRF